MRALVSSNRASRESRKPKLARRRTGRQRRVNPNERRTQGGEKLPRSRLRTEHRIAGPVGPGAVQAKNLRRNSSQLGDAPSRKSANLGQAGFPQRNSCFMICTITGENPGRTGDARYPTPAARWQARRAVPDSEATPTGAGPTVRHPAPNQPPERRAATRDKGAMRPESVFHRDRNSPAGAMWRGIQQPLIDRPRQRQCLGGVFRRRRPGAPGGQGATARAHLLARSKHVDSSSLHRHVGVKCR